ncbi:hypothetical protein, partial [Cupriavidus sp. AcVe19-6a]|uniref:hypothetical protein n=1 Tax=Cupriavidus sp. AcVe19-6a TaxID=2821358 RepID=UPI001FD86755
CRYFFFVIHHTLPNGKVLHFRFEDAKLIVDIDIGGTAFRGLPVRSGRSGVSLAPAGERDRTDFAACRDGHRLAGTEDGVVIAYLADL